jgi:hypothetical protein
VHTRELARNKNLGPRKVEVEVEEALVKKPGMKAAGTF